MKCQRTKRQRVKCQGVERYRHTATAGARRTYRGRMYRGRVIP